MYFWIGGDINKPEIIAKNAILCQVKSLSVLSGEYKGKPSYKLIISIQADEPYQLVMGLETLTCKTALLGLMQADLAQPVKLSFRAGKADNALFCDVYQNSAKLEHSQYLNTIAEPIVLEMIETLSIGLKELSGAELPPIEEELEPSQLIAPSIAPVPEAEPEPQKKPPNENGRRVKEACGLLGMKGRQTADAYNAAAIAQKLDKPSGELTAPECSRVIDEILALWGFKRGGFKAINHARNAFASLMENPEISDIAAIVVAWKADCEKRIEKSQEVTATW